MPIIFSALAWFGSAVVTFFSGIASDVRRYALRALAVAAAAGSFWISFNIIYDGVKGTLDSVVSQIQGAQGSFGFTMQLGLCMMPSTLPDAMSVLFGVALAAVTVKWIREILFLKLA